MVHNIVKGAVEAERKYAREAWLAAQLPGLTTDQFLTAHLTHITQAVKKAIAQEAHWHKAPCTTQAMANSCKNLKLQNKLQGLVHSIVKGAVEAERKFNCGALPCDLREQISRDEGLHTKVACKIYGILQNKL